MKQKNSEFWGKRSGISVGLSHIRLTIHVGLVVKVAVQFSVPVVWKEIPHPATLVQDHYSSLCLSFNVDSPVGYSIQPCHCLSRHPKVMTLRSAQDSIGTVRDSISCPRPTTHIFADTLHGSSYLHRRLIDMKGHYTVAY